MLLLLMSCVQSLDGFHERFDFLDGFLSLHFEAAGNIDTEGMENGFDFCDIVLGHAACDEEPAPKLRHLIDRLRGLAPREAPARAARQFCRAAVEQDVVCREYGSGFCVKALAIAVSLDDGPFDFCGVRRVLVAVQLDEIEPNLGCNRVDALGRFIDKDADRLDAVELRYDSRGLLRRDIPAALRPEDEADECRTRHLGRLRSGQRLHAAKLRFHEIPRFFLPIFPRYTKRPDRRISLLPGRKIRCATQLSRTQACASFSGTRQIA